MNNERRKLLKKEALVFLEQAYKSVCYVLQMEEIALDNMPENLQNSEKYEDMVFAIQSLEKCIDKLDEAKDELCDIVA